MEPTTDPRMAVILTARALFRRQGVAGTSMREIADASGVQRGSLTFYFPGGKAQLVRHVATYSADELRDAVDAGLQAADPPTVYQTMAAMIGAVLEQSDWWEGSPLATIALETSATDDDLRETCRRGYASIESVIHEALVRAGVEHEEALDLVALTSASLEGSLIRARLDRSLEPLNRSTRQVVHLLRSRIAAAGHSVSPG